MSVHHYLIPLLAHPATGEEGLGIQPVQQVEGELQRQEAQEVPLQQRLQSIGQVAQLHCAAQGDELVQRLVALRVVECKEGGRDRLQPRLKGCLLHGHMGAMAGTLRRKGVQMLRS